MTEPNFEKILVEEIFPQGEMMLIEPLGFVGEKKSKSGILIAESHTQATPTVGKVLSAGSSSKYKPGEFVFFRRYSLDEIEIDMADGKKKMNFISDEDVISTYVPKQ